MSESSGMISIRLAMSLDGYIADEEGGYDWILPVESPTLDTDHQLPFDEFLDDVDLVVMGGRCYDQGQHRDYVALGKKVIVATSTRSGPEQREQGIDFVGMSWKWSGLRETRASTASSSEAGYWSSPSPQPTPSTC